MKSFHRLTLLAAPRYRAYLKTQATGGATRESSGGSTGEAAG